MDTASLIAFVEHAYWLVNQGPESSEVTFEEVRDTLWKLDRIAYDMSGVRKMMANVRPYMEDLVTLMSGRPTIHAVASAPAHPMVASTRAEAHVAASPTTVHVSTTPATSLVAASVFTSQPAVTPTTTPVTVSRVAGPSTVACSNISDTRTRPPPADLHPEPGETPAYPPTLILSTTSAREAEKEPNRDTWTRPRPTALLAATPLIRPIVPQRHPSMAVDKGKGRDTRNEALSALRPQKRSRSDTQGDDDLTQSSGGTDDKVGADPGVLLDLQMTPSATGSMAVICDSSGEEVTWVRLSRALERYLSIPLDVLPTVYRLCYGCALVPHGADTHEFLLRLTEIEGFEYWYIPLEGADPNRSLGLEILRRDGPALEATHQQLRQKLAKEQGTTVVAPKLWHFLTTLCCMRVGLLTGPILNEMFTKATGQSLNSLNVITEHGVHQYTADQLAEMLKKWLRDLCAYIAEENHLEDLLKMATNCNAAYRASRRESRNGGAYIDQGHTIAQEMLASNEHNSQLILGISSNALERLYKDLVFFTDKDVGEVTLRYLKSLSDSLYSEQR